MSWVWACLCSRWWEQQWQSICMWSILCCFNRFSWCCWQATHHPLSNNIFDTLPSLSAPAKAAFTDELMRYLTAPTEATCDPLLWWVEKQAVYPCLSRMARNYLSVPGMLSIIWPLNIKMTPPKQLLLMWNMYSARGGLYCHTSITIFQLTRHKHSFALGIGGWS